MTSRRDLTRIIGTIFILFVLTGKGQIAFINGGLTATENFNSLAVSGTSSTLPTGWAFSESGTNANATYAADAGATSTGNTYSYGTGTGSERAFGEVASGSLISTIGASFINNTDSDLVQLNISFYTELWRKGVAGVKDSIIFEYSTDATSLTTGTWTAVTTLNAVTPNLAATVGANDGDLVANRALRSGSVTGISVAPSSTIWIRWRAVNISGNDDGLGIDDFSITAVKGAPVLIPASISISGTEKSVSENSGTATFYLKITGSNTSASSMEVIASAWSTAASGTDYALASTTITFPANSTNNDSLPVTITITDDANAESDEYIIFTLGNGVNASASGTAQYVVYIRDNDMMTPAGTSELNLNFLTSFSNGSSPANSAEIVAYDSLSQRLFIANSLNARLDIVNFSNPSAPVLMDTIDISIYGNINSVAARNGIIAVAIENGINPQDSGMVAFFDTAGTFVKSVKVGMMPDMITFNHAGTKVYTANEGEPNQAYTTDPDGSVSVIDISGGLIALSQSNVSHITFTSFNGTEAALRASGIRVYGTGASASMDFEPEYITISDDDSKAWVVLQENNALAVVNLTSNTVTNIVPLGYKDHSLAINAMDASDQTSSVNIASWPTKGMYQPDAIAQYSSGGNTYLLTANEGDSRAYSGFNEESRVSGLTLDPVKFPNASQLKNNLTLGRINATNKWGDSDNDGDIDTIYTYGSRSFSIWNGSTGAQVYDSGSELERITASHPLYSSVFNASNGTTAVKKNRSDDKGPEPEGVATASINGKQYLFLALERTGGLMIYNIDNPAAPYYVNYHNNRPTDRGSEGIVYISASQSPSGKSLVILANETSSTLSIYEVESCVASLNLALSPSTTGGYCPGDSLMISNTGNSGATFSWIKDGAVVSGVSSSSLYTNQPGNYSLIIDKGIGCKDTTSIVSVSAYTAPISTITPATAASACANDSVKFSAHADNTYSYQWLMNGLPVSGETDSVYYANTNANISVVISNTSDCTDTTSEITFTLIALPNASVTTSGTLNFCTGEDVTLSATTVSGNTYQWFSGTTAITGETNPSYIAANSGNYYVVVSNASGCSDTSATFAVTSNAYPLASISAASGTTSCGGSVQLNGTFVSGATYQWLVNGIPAGSTNLNYTAFSSGAYSQVVTSAQGCKDTSNVISASIFTNPSAPVITQDMDTLTSSAAASYQWYLNGSPISGATNQDYIVLQNGTYSVEITDSNGCIATSSSYVVTTLSSSAAELTTAVTVFPNPLRSNGTLNLMLATENEVSINVYNQLGEVVFSIPASRLAKGAHQRTLVLAGFASGIYILKVTIGQQQVIRKLVLEN